MEPRRDFLKEAIDIAVGRVELKPEKEHILALLNLYDPTGVACLFGVRNLEQYLDWCDKRGLTPSGLGFAKEP